MVWIIPRDSDENMFKQLICLMTNIEANRHIFNLEGKLITDNEKNTQPFNVYENEYFIDEYRFVKGYICCTGITITNSNIEERLANMNHYMKQDISLDINHCYPTAHYTVARIPLNKEYSRRIVYDNQKLKGIKYKHNFIWINKPFNVNSFQELKTNKSHVYPETYDLMKSLSTIIYDNGGIFALDYTGQPITPGKLINNVNLPEIWQLHGSNRIINIPIILSGKFNIRNNLRKKFEHLIPDAKKFAPNRALYKDNYVAYREGIKNSTYAFNIIEKKNLNELNIPSIDLKESIIKKIKNKDSIYQMMKININESNKNQLTHEVIHKFLSCHACFTPLYGDFYYIHAEHKENYPTPHVPICALCMHNNNSTVFGKVDVGISNSILMPSTVISMIPRPHNVSHENYEKYKNILDVLLYKIIEVDKENPSGVIASFDGIKLVTEIHNSMLFEKETTDIFMIELVK